MEQGFNVVCCYSCKMHQVNMVTKSKKWRCKICNEKQTLQMIYYHGSSGDCREYVMGANAAKGAIENEKNFILATIAGYGLDCESSRDEICDCQKIPITDSAKWYKYLNQEEESTQRDKENFASQEKRKNFLKRDCAGRQTRSLPTTRNFEPKCTNTRSHSFPAKNYISKLPGKWEKFLTIKESISEENDGKTFLLLDRTNIELSEDESYVFSSSENNEESELTRSRGNFAKIAKMDFPTLEKKWKEIVDAPDDQVSASGGLKCSQVDTSSGSTSTTYRDIENNIFDDLDEIGIKIDF